MSKSILKTKHSQKTKPHSINKNQLSINNSAITEAKERVGRFEFVSRISINIVCQKF